MFLTDEPIFVMCRGHSLLSVKGDSPLSCSLSPSSTPFAIALHSTAIPLNRLRVGTCTFDERC
jgi:hypothetical protein